MWDLETLDKIDENNNKLISYPIDPDIDILLPYPKKQEQPDLDFANKLDELKIFFDKISYMGISHDRFGDKNMGCSEYSFKYDNIEYVFPEGYLIYLKES